MSLLLIASLTPAGGVFALVWAACVRIDNYGYLDVVWSLGVARAVLFSPPFLLASLNPHPGLRPMEIAGLLLALFATGGESLADWQAQRFKRNPRDKPAIVNVGLWRYSRTLT